MEKLKSIKDIVRNDTSETQRVRNRFRKNDPN